LIETAPASARAAIALHWRYGYFPHWQGEQLQSPRSHEQELPHWHAAAGFTFVLRFFGCLRFDFIVIDLFAFSQCGPGIIARIHRPFTRANAPAQKPLHSFLGEYSR
jgi:hypothetical protein